MKRLLIIDSSVTASSPTMQAWLRAAPKVLPSRFDEVEVWGFRCELSFPWVKFRYIRPVTKRWAIQSIFYERQVKKMISTKPASYWAETLVQCTGTHVDHADIRYIQFWHKAYTDAAAARPNFLKLPLKDRLLTGRISKREEITLQPGNTVQWWCVSRGIAAPIIRDSGGYVDIQYLPNSYDSLRFNHDTRIRNRKNMRKHYGLKDDEIVFAFSAFGHFERKGLRQAAASISLLRESGYFARLLILGGSISAISRFRKQMKKNQISLDGCLFSGLVNSIEEHLAAADGFLLPSHFEAFSLAEIEAAALGLRLYLTAHPGHEMILRENINGRLLPWDPLGMAHILEEEIKAEAFRQSHNELGEALDPNAYATRMGELYDDAIRKKWGNI